MQVEGPNGCGKTTLLRSLVTLFPEFSGEIFWKGQLIHQTTQVRQDFLCHFLFIGHLPAVAKTLTPRENLAFLAGLHQPVSMPLINEALARIGLYGYEELPGHQLSAGQLRRVGLARLYLSRAPVWVLDEPFTAIDKQGIANLKVLFNEHLARGGCIILASHQPLDITSLKRMSLADYVPNNQAANRTGSTVSGTGLRRA